MRYLNLVIIIILLLPAEVLAEIAVIVSPSSGIEALTRHQIIDIYMGRNTTLEDGKQLQPFDQSKNSVARAKFYHHITGKSVAEINAYWARLIFTGRATPPKLVDDNQTMLEAVENNANVIGYLEPQYLNDRVIVIYRLRLNE